MGLDISHDTWHGSYSAFHRWRKKIAETAGLPPLELMEGFCDNETPIKWDCLKPNSLHELLNHSDCDGYISPESCKCIAESLQDLMPLLSDEEVGGHIGNMKDKTQIFIDGLLLAHSMNEPVIFQ